MYETSACTTAAKCCMHVNYDNGPVAAATRIIARLASDVREFSKAIAPANCCYKAHTCLTVA